ncbi:hypothetical protein HMI54_000439 [Coelomomyces lativittatus]|nr:hypothetical protein HMI55_002845 [Coelomomyces lativittatus]KAJ1511880.1 hypothetical protein HMI54_000439 [Coelomomyces lativittatus]
MTSPESSHPLLKNFLKTWNSISVETQTEESDLPSTLKIELELGTLKKKLEYQSDFLQVRNTSILHDRLEELKNEMMRQCLKLENENQSTLTRMRIAAKLEAMNEAKMIEAKWKANYEKKLSEISQENQILNEELTRLKKSFRVSQIQASEEIVQLKAALANSFSWITKNYGELASKVLIFFFL